MYDYLIADLLDLCLDTEEDFGVMIGNQLKCLTGQAAESPLYLSELPA